MTATLRGSGHAGVAVAAGLRTGGWDGRIVLIDAQHGTPYERPPLSKAVLRGEAAAATTRVHDDAFYHENEIEVVTGKAVRELDAPGRYVRIR